uniref:Uncharacterized protein n=1 Tax=Macrostomum lignano TaxID=282301 RepID=A0A1I8H7M3_9PLAT
MFGNPFGEFQQDPFFDFGSAALAALAIRVAITSTPPLRFTTNATAGPPAQVPGHGRAFAAEDLQHQQRRAISTGRSAATAATVGGEMATSDELPPWCRRGPSTGRGGGRPCPGQGYSFGLPQFDRLFEGVERMMSDAGERMLAAQEASQRPDFNAKARGPTAMRSVYAYRSDGSGEPQVYQAVSESRAGLAEFDSRSREERIRRWAPHHRRPEAGTRLRGREHGGTLLNEQAAQRRGRHHYDGIDERGQQFDREWTGVLLASPLKDGAGGARPPRRSLSAPSAHHGRQALKVTRLCGIC